MTALHTLKRETFSIELLRDEHKVIARHGGTPEEIKKAFAKVGRLKAKLPLSAGTALDLQKTRESRGRA